MHYITYIYFFVKKPFILKGFLISYEIGYFSEKVEIKG